MKLAEFLGIFSVIMLIAVIIFLIMFVVGMYTQNESPKKIGKIGMIIAGILLIVGGATMLLI